MAILREICSQTVPILTFNLQSIRLLVSCFFLYYLFFSNTYTRYIVTFNFPIFVRVVKCEGPILISQWAFFLFLIVCLPNYVVRLFLLKILIFSKDCCNSKIQKHECPRSLCIPEFNLTYFYDNHIYSKK